MKILFIGDIMGKSGRRVVSAKLPQIRAEHNVDFCIANCENLTSGRGITPEKIAEMQSVGVDFFTSGNHIWQNRKVIDALDDVNLPVLRPANYPQVSAVKGRGWEIVKIGRQKVLIINLIGRVFMPKHYDCPFRCIDEILEKTKSEKLTGIIVDFHAEASSEKIALKHYLDGRITALLGTHTHIPTADAEITAQKMAYITDVGMTGPTDSVIGMKKEIIIESFLSQLPQKFEVATGPGTLHGVLIEIKKSQAHSIRLLQVSE